MGKASRSKRRAAVRSAKRSRTNTWWYGLTAIVLIAGIALVVYAKATAPGAVGPLVSKDHWHAALGVYDCDHWLGNGQKGPGTWDWPGTSSTGIFRVGTQVYAGMHSHGDGIIHMEPSQSDEAGRNATVGRYFSFGGWNLSSTGYS
ncbi:MAG TPA: hypothetical protein VFR41_15380, partial [Acidimicrobiia bacterium]|nr:hypothetical protein [Acidimicrobiia bacterium]